MTTVIPQLASSLRRQDARPNVKLAEDIARTKDRKAVAELLDVLRNGNARLKSDALKTLYEVGLREPLLIANYMKDFVALLDATNNRMVWGAMEALDGIAAKKPALIFPHVMRIHEAALSGSVITRDHAVGIFAKLAKETEYAKLASEYLLEMVRIAPINQLPAYAEKAERALQGTKRESLRKLLADRLPEVPQPAKIKRIESVLKKLA